MKTSKNTSKPSLQLMQRFKRATLVSFMVIIAAIALSGTVFAADADSLWNTVATLIGTWVTRLGGVVMFVGVVMFGLGWKSDDAEGKSRGISTLIAGAIVTAAAVMVDIFFA